MFFTEKILEKLLMHTNRKLYKNNNIIHTNATFKQLNIMKLRTFIAFLYLMIIILKIFNSNIKIFFFSICEVFKYIKYPIHYSSIIYIENIKF